MEYIYTLVTAATWNFLDKQNTFFFVIINTLITDFRVCFEEWQLCYEVLEIKSLNIYYTYQMLIL